MATFARHIMDPQQAFDAATGSGSSDDAMVSLIHNQKLSKALKLRFSPTLAGRTRMAPLEFAHRENVPAFYQLDWQDLSPLPVDDASENSDDSDGAMVALIHRKKLSNARRQQNSRRRMEPIEFAPANVPQFYQQGARPVDELSDR